VVASCWPVNVDGFFVEENQRAGNIHFADDRGGAVMFMMTKFSLVPRRKLMVWPKGLLRPVKSLPPNANNRIAEAAAQRSGRSNIADLSLGILAIQTQRISNG